MHLKCLGMSETFFTQPILNSPYEYPGKHWELDDDGQPTHKIIEARREAKFQAPIPKPRKRSKGQADGVQQSLTFDTDGLSDESQKYDLFFFINSIRAKVNAWRQIPNPSDWKVTPETARLLQYWRHHSFQSIRPFFCQVEAVETAIWLAEVAPSGGVQDKAFLEHVQSVNGEANPELLRVALKLATGGWENDGHGHADCLADDQCGAATPKQTVHSGFLGGDAGYYDSRSPSGSSAQ